MSAKLKNPIREPRSTHPILARVESVCLSQQWPRGIYKRIDENRELLRCLQQDLHRRSSMKFEVEVPYMAKITCQVEGNSPKEAINKAKQRDCILETENSIGETGESLWKKASARQITMN